MKNGLIIDENRNQFWYQNDKRHRDNGPAIEWNNGNKYWYQNGKRHRIDGPAIEYFDGYKIWYFKGKEIEVSCQEEFERVVKLKAFW